jgi:hypothetical protein
MSEVLIPIYGNLLCVVPLVGETIAGVFGISAGGEA